MWRVISESVCLLHNVKEGSKARWTCTLKHTIIGCLSCCWSVSAAPQTDSARCYHLRHRVTRTTFNAAGMVCIRVEINPEQDGCNVERVCRSGAMCDPVRRVCIVGTDYDCRQVGCPGGQVCDQASGDCEVRGGQGCVDNNDCVQGLCLDGLCYSVECALDTHCDATHYCEDGRCIPRIADCIDFDGDGYGSGARCLGPDCDDNDPGVHPGMVEDASAYCEDGIDQDCDGIDHHCGGRMPTLTASRGH